VKSSNLLGFAKKAGALKEVIRTGWLDAAISNPESVADHSYRCAMLAMLLGDLRGLDADRMMRMALLHDLHESITGDLTPRQKAEQPEQLEIAEGNAMRKILSDLPHVLRSEYSAILEEYRNQHSLEARLLEEIDKLEMALQALEYKQEGYAVKALDQFLRTAHDNVHDVDLKALMSAAQAEANESTHQ